MNYRKKAILMVMALFCLNIAILAQAVSLKMDNVSVKEAMTQLKNKSGYSFVYKVGDLDTKKIITVKAKELNEAIDQILYGQDVVYEVKGKNVIVQKGQARQNTSKDGKKRKITGVVNDVNGEPIIGVTIKEKGTTNGTVSDINAKFTLEVSPGAVLELSYIGYQPLEVKVGNQTDLSIVLYEKQELLDEVVVVGYGTMKKSDLNASIVSVKSEKLNKAASPNFSEMLMGRAAGLTVKQGSAQPGGGIEVLIRGAASTGAGNDPLYVVDGFPIVNAGVNPGSGNQWTAGSNSPLSSINPNDIESIEILKDASATAIYGARGANGVVLITTKRGTQDTKVEYNMNMSFQTINKRPELLTAGELMTTQNSYYKEQYLMQNLVYPYGNTDPGAVSPYVPMYTDEEIAKAGKGTNWYDMITRTGLIQQHNLTVTYGNEKMRSLISLNYFDQKGVVKTSGYKRYSFRYNLDHKITKWWDYGISATASYVVDQNATLGGGYDSTAGIIESALSYSPTVKAERDPTTGKWMEDPKQALLNHPLSYLDIEDETKTKRFLATAFTNFYFIKDVFWLKLSAGADIRDGSRHSYYPMTTKYGSSVNGDANINSANREDYVADMVFNFQKTFKERHKLLALLGYSYQVQNDDGAYARAMGFMSDALMYYKLQAGETRPVVSSYKNKHVLASYFGRAQYSFKDKYLFTFTARIDGSDRFGKNNRYAFFPSGAFAWRMNQEDFLKDVNWLSDAKLRVSMGQVGNENLPNDAASEYFAFDGRNYYLGDTEKRGVNLGKFGNPDLKWETTTEVNFGLDFGFFRNRINGSVDVFFKEVKDLLSWRSLPHTAVTTGIWSNIGKTKSTGFELTLNTVNLEGPLHWESTLTYTSYRDRWKERDPKVILAPYVKENDPVSAIYTLIPDGIKQAGEDTPAMPDLLPGQRKYKDVNGLDEEGNLTGKPDGKIDQADVVYLGTRAPKFTMGFSNDFRYKGFDLNIYLYASVGGYSYPYTQVEHGVYGGNGIQRLKDNNNFLADIKNRWTSDNMGSAMPSGEVNSYDSYGAPNWEKNTYLRLKNVTLGYDLSRLFKANKLKVRFYFSGQNLLTFTGYKGLDPEVENDRASYPQQKTFSFGLDVKF